MRNYVTYHQRESSEHHDQQDDHRSYEHLSGCREKRRERERKTFTQQCIITAHELLQLQTGSLLKAKSLPPTVHGMRTATSAVMVNGSC